MKVSLTGIKPTGQPHIGNLLGAIRPAIEMSKSGEYDRHIYFIADAHALTSIRNPKEFSDYVYEIAATWIALGLDTKKSIFFKQSDVKQVFELQWILSCLTPKGDMNRAHSYKDRLQKNEELGKEPDFGVNMGLYSYPVLMSADILLYDTTHVPVGKDQVQHLEIARNIAVRTNEIFGEGTLIEPETILQKEGAYIPGLDGRKMSKSYQNTIPLWETEKRLKKLINKITTDSSAPEEPKDPNESLIMDLYKLFATESEIKDLSEQYRKGIGWGHAKAALFEVVNRYLEEPRKIFNDLIEDRTQLDQILKEGAEQASEIAEQNMRRIRKAVTGFAL